MAVRFTFSQYFPSDRHQGTVNRQAILREDPRLMCKDEWRDEHDISSENYKRKKGLDGGSLNDDRIARLIESMRG